MAELHHVVDYLYGLINGAYTSKALFIALIFMSMLSAWHVYTAQATAKVPSIVKLSIKTVATQLFALILYIAIFICIMSWLGHLPFLTIEGDRVQGVGDAALLSYMTIIMLIPLSYWIMKALTGAKKIVLTALQCLISFMITIIFMSSFIAEAPFNGGLLAINALLNVVLSLTTVYVYAKWTKRRHIRLGRTTAQSEGTMRSAAKKKQKRQRQRRKF